MPKLKTLILTTVCLLLFYSTYAVFQADDYATAVHQEVPFSEQSIRDAVSNLSTWPQWTNTENEHLQYELDTSGTEDVLRWNTPGTSNNGYRQLLRKQGDKIVFRWVDGQGSEFIETIQLKANSSQSTDITWQVTGNSDEIVEKIMRPAIRYAINNSRQTYIDNLASYLAEKTSQ